MYIESRMFTSFVISRPTSLWSKLKTIWYPSNMMSWIINLQILLVSSNNATFTLSQKLCRNLCTRWFLFFVWPMGKNVYRISNVFQLCNFSVTWQMSLRSKLMTNLSIKYDLMNSVSLNANSIFKQCNFCIVFETVP